MVTAQRAHAFAEACEKIETIHGDGKKAASPVLIDGKTAWPEKAVVHPALERIWRLRDMARKK